jgi:uncharacterized membrane protein
MSTVSIKPQTENIELPTIHKVDMTHPWMWLGRGWRDLRRSWPVALTYGALFAALGYLLVSYAWTRVHLVLTLTSGFLLVAPFFAICFYSMSRRLEEGGEVRELFKPVSSFGYNPASIGLFAVMLAFMLSVWERLSAVVVALFLRTDIVTDQPFSLGLLFRPEHLDFVIPYFVFGALVAAFVFALSVVSLPMMLARKVDVITAIVTSLWVVRVNLLPMLLWAFLIGSLMLVGQALWFVPLVVIFPLLGHASWHAYRDLVEDS